MNSGSSVITPGRGSTAADDTPLREDLSSALDHADYTNGTKQRRKNVFIFYKNRFLTFDVSSPEWLESNTVFVSPVLLS